MKRLVNEVKGLWKYNKAVAICMGIAILCTVIYTVVGIYLLATGQYDSEHMTTSARTIATLWWMR